MCEAAHALKQRFGRRNGNEAAAARDMIVDAWRASVGMGVGYPMISVRDIESGKRILTRDDFGRD